MQIVAFDKDDKADNTGKTPITWIVKNRVSGLHTNMNPV